MIDWLIFVLPQNIFFLYLTCVESDPTHCWRLRRSDEKFLEFAIIKRWWTVESLAKVAYSSAAVVSSSKPQLYRQPIIIQHPLLYLGILHFRIFSKNFFKYGYNRNSPILIYIVGVPLLESEDDSTYFKLIRNDSFKDTYVVQMSKRLYKLLNQVFHYFSL